MVTARTEGPEMARGWEIARRRWRLALTVFMVPLSAAVALAAFLPGVYRASTVVLVDRQQVPETFVRSTVTSGPESRLQTISQEVLKRGRLEELIQRFDLYRELRASRSMEAATDRMRREIQLEARTDPVVRGGALAAFTVSYTGRDPETVAAVTNTLASLYLSENSRVREREASGTAEFLRKELDDVKERLAEQEARVSAFKRRHIGENPSNMEGNLAVLERLTAQLRLNSDSQNRAMERRQALSRQLAGSEGIPSTVGGAAADPVDAPGARLAKLHQELIDLRTRFSDKYPDVIRLKAEIAAAMEAQAQSAGRVAEGATPAPPESALNPYAFKLRQAMAEAEAELTTLRTEERRLREDFTTYQRRVENTPLREQEFQALSRDYETTSELYRTLLKRYEEAQLAETLEQRQKGEQFRILEMAIPPSVPWAPNRMRLLLMGGLMSAGLALASVWLSERLDASVHGVNELRGLARFPVVARIPQIVSEGDAARRRWRLVAWACVTVLAVMITAGATYATAKGHVPLLSGVTTSLFLRR
jgi:polysaccharide chain length determinant protein (PEP-CTERM system associated)